MHRFMILASTIYICFKLHLLQAGNDIRANTSGFEESNKNVKYIENYCQNYFVHV